MMKITTSESCVRERRREGIAIMWQAPRDSCAVGTCVGTSPALRSTAASLMVRRKVSWERATNGYIFWLSMTPIVTFTNAAHQQVHHGGMDSQVLRAFILVSHMTQNDRHGASTRPPRPTRLDGQDAADSNGDSKMRCRRRRRACCRAALQLQGRVIAVRPARCLRV